MLGRAGFIGTTSTVSYGSVVRYAISSSVIVMYVMLHYTYHACIWHVLYMCIVYYIVH